MPEYPRLRCFEKNTAFAHMKTDAPCDRCAYRQSFVCQDCHYEIFGIQELREKVTRNQRGWRRLPGLSEEAKEILGCAFVCALILFAGWLWIQIGGR